jgi:hypothetical protein
MNGQLGFLSMPLAPKELVHRTRPQPVSQIEKEGGRTAGFTDGDSKDSKPLPQRRLPAASSDVTRAMFERLEKRCTALEETLLAKEDEIKAEMEDEEEDLSLKRKIWLHSHCPMAIEEFQEAFLSRSWLGLSNNSYGKNVNLLTFRLLIDFNFHICDNSSFFFICYRKRVCPENLRSILSGSLCRFLHSQYPIEWLYIPRSACSRDFTDGLCLICRGCTFVCCPVFLGLAFEQ